MSYRSFLISTYPFGWNEAAASRSMSLPGDPVGASQGKDDNKSINMLFGSEIVLVLN